MLYRLAIVVGASYSLAVPSSLDWSRHLINPLLTTWNHLFTPDILVPTQIGAFLVALHNRKVERRPESLSATIAILHEHLQRAAPTRPVSSVSSPFILTLLQISLIIDQRCNISCSWATRCRQNFSLSKHVQHISWQCSWRSQNMCWCYIQSRICCSTAACYSSRRSWQNWTK